MFRRPKIVNFMCIQSGEYLHLRASMTLSQKYHFDILEDLNRNISELVPARPIQNLGLLSSHHFSLKIYGYNENDEELFIKQHDSDSFGNFNFKIPIEKDDKISRLIVFETNYRQGVELLIGIFFPTKIKTPKQIIITDFDKTLVDTKYSSLKEVYQSLKNPIQFFPPVKVSIDLLNQQLEKGHQPFVVSASPHFYEKPIRDWLYQNNIYTSNIFLKDYRTIFSVFQGELATKDIKSQGFYKFNTIVNILLMTGIPDDLVLMGDGFESDTLIYLALASILVGRYDPRAIWNSVKREESFRLNPDQNVRFLSKIYLLKNSSESHKKGQLKIYIRCNSQLMLEKLESRVFNLDFANQLKHLVTYYIG